MDRLKDKIVLITGAAGAVGKAVAAAVGPRAALPSPAIFPAVRGWRMPSTSPPRQTGCG